MFILFKNKVLNLIIIKSNIRINKKNKYSFLQHNPEISQLYYLIKFIVHYINMNYNKYIKYKYIFKVKYLNYLVFIQKIKNNY